MHLSTLRQIQLSHLPHQICRAACATHSISAGLLNATSRILRASKSRKQSHSLTSLKVAELSNPEQSIKMTSTPVPKHLNFITGNKNKLAEVQAILEGVIELRNQNVDLVEIQGTVEEVTLDKARRAAEAVCFTSKMS